MLQAKNKSCKLAIAFLRWTIVYHFLKIIFPFYLEFREEYWFILQFLTLQKNVKTLIIKIMLGTAGFIIIVLSFYTIVISLYLYIPVYTGTMPFRSVYRKADIFALSCSFVSAEIYISCSVELCEWHSRWGDRFQETRGTTSVEREVKYLKVISIC